MVHIDTTSSLESFRRFLINSTCLSFIPDSYLRDYEVFPEKEGESGSIYVEAADKVTLKKMRDITFVNARDILGIIYVSKSGNTKLKWRQIRGRAGRVTGEASTNSLVNLFTSRVLSQEYADQLLVESKGEQRQMATAIVSPSSGSSGTSAITHTPNNDIEREAQVDFEMDGQGESLEEAQHLPREQTDQVPPTEDEEAVEGSIQASDDV